MEATIPVTTGAARLVPATRFRSTSVRDCAARTNSPGAETSGFCECSLFRDGPELVVSPSLFSGVRASYDPTTMALSPQAMELSVEKSSILYFDFALSDSSGFIATKQDCPVSSRSIQAWNRVPSPFFAFVQCKRNVQSPGCNSFSKKTLIVFSPEFGSSRRLTTESNPGHFSERSICHPGATLPQLRLNGSITSTVMRSSGGYQISNSFGVESFFGMLHFRSSISPSAICPDT